MNKKELLFLILVTCFTYLACAGNKAQEADFSAQLSVADSTNASKNVDKTGEYLKVKFRQNDTEVEMVLDPQSTNLALDLLRGPEGFMEVTAGDSVLFEKGKKREEDERLLDSGKDGMGGEHLTDEIVRDINLAQRLFYERKYEEALRTLKASLQKRKTATAYALGGSIYYVNGDVAAAVNAWENALEINPNLEEVRQLVVRYKE